MYEPIAQGSLKHDENSVRCEVRCWNASAHSPQSNQEGATRFGMATFRLCASLHGGRNDAFVARGFAAAVDAG